MTGMHLDPEDERILAGEEGETRQKLLELLVALGKVFGAERLVPIASAQVSGASYKTIGKYGLEWLASLDAKAVVPAVLNPIGMARTRWEEMGIDPAFAENQQPVVKVRFCPSPLGSPIWMVVLVLLLVEKIVF